MNVRQNYQLAFFLILPAFFAWGFISSLNALLAPQLQTLFHLDYAMSMLVQSFYFAAYGLFPVPITRLILKTGHQQTIVIGFTIAACGCLIFIPASYAAHYAFYLVGVFTISTGAVMLEVTCNPYVSLLGKPENSSSRLTFAQAFTGAGFVVAPLVATLLLLRPGNIANQVRITYGALAVILLLLAMIIFFLPLPALHQHFGIEKTKHTDKDPTNKQKNHLTFKAFPGLWLGCLALFIDCGLEMTIGSFLMRFIQHVKNISAAQAAQQVTIFWLLFLCGRFTGVVLLRYITSTALLCVATLSGSIFVALAISLHNPDYAVVFMLMTGLCNSVLFPIIFSRALQGLGKKTTAGAAYLSTAITGGAVTPLLQGFFADTFSLHTSFLVPLLSYLIVFTYAIGSKYLLPHD